MLFSETGLDVFNPFVLIRGAQTCSDDRKLSLSAKDARRLVGQRGADAFRRRLIDEEVARVFLGIGIPGQHFDAFLAGFPQHG